MQNLRQKNDMKINGGLLEIGKVKRKKGRVDKKK
jgi:hypothetical protein